MSPLYIVSISKWIFKVIFVVMQALSEFVFHLLFLNEILRHLCSKNALFQRMRSMQQSYPKFFLEKSIHENRLQKCLFFFPQRIYKRHVVSCNGGGHCPGVEATEF